MEKKRDQLEPWSAPVEEMTKGIGRGIVQTLITKERELVTQGRDASLALGIVLAAVVNGLAVYVAARSYPEPDQDRETARLYDGLNQALIALLEARPSVASEVDDTWPTGRMGTA